MKMMKKALALMLVIMLILPSMVVADAPTDIDDNAIILDGGALDNATDGGDLDIAMDDADLPTGDANDLLLEEPGDIILDGQDFEPDSNAANSAPLPFEQKVELEGVTITVTANAGAFPEGAVLRVSDVIEDAVARAAREAAETALPGMAVKHHLYSIEVVDRDGNTVLPAHDMAMPMAHIAGINITGDLHVFGYDANSNYEADAKCVDGGIEFGFEKSAVYDIAEASLLPADGEGQPEQPEQPADGQQEQPADDQPEQPADDQQEQPADDQQEQPADDQQEQPADDQQEQSADDQQEQSADDQQEQPADDQQEQSADDQDDQGDQETTSSVSPDGEPASQGSADPSSLETAHSAVSDPLGPPQGEASGDGETDNETSEDAQKPSPVGEGAEQSEADEVLGEQGSDNKQVNEDQPADGQKGKPADDQTDDGETSSGADAPPERFATPPAAPEGKAFGEPTEPADDEQEQQDNPTDGEPTEQPTEESHPVTVIFNATPETATISVHPAAQKPSPVGVAEGAAERSGAEQSEADEVLPENNSEQSDPIPAESGNTYALLPGDYTYAAAAEGYIAIENIPFTVEASEEPVTVSVTLEPIEQEPEPEPVPFNQSRTVNGVVVTVQADPGVFPANALLSVSPLTVKKRLEAEKAVEEVRDEDVNVVVSYTFDIKVIDPDTKQELQPADGESVSVSFACEKVADANLDTSVYHIDDTGEAEKLDVVTEEETTDGSAPSATVETEGFSSYVVEFTHLPLVYRASLTSEEIVIPVSDILTNLGLTGTYTKVTSGDSATVFSIVEDSNDMAIKINNEGEQLLYVTINDSELEITVNAIKMGTYTVSNWEQLQARFEQGGYIKLENTVDNNGLYRADPNNPNHKGLVVKSGKTVVLDLRGCTINRNLPLVGDNIDGYVILVENNATLTITDTINEGLDAGVITGGCNKGRRGENGEPVTYNFGGGIQNYGTLILEEGVITGNSAIASGGASGGGIYNAGTLHLNGGCITNNVGIGGGGIYNDANGRITLSGTPQVWNNDGYGGGNLYLAGNSVIEITGPLKYGSEFANLCVDANDNRSNPAITSGYKQHNQYNSEVTNPREFFTADGAKKGINLTEDGEEVGLYTRRRISVDEETEELFTVTFSSGATFDEPDYYALPRDTVSLQIEPKGETGLNGFWVQTKQKGENGQSDKWVNIKWVNPKPADPEEEPTPYTFTMPNEEVRIKVAPWNKIETDTILYQYNNATIPEAVIWNNHATLTAPASAAADSTVTLTLTTEPGYVPAKNGLTVTFIKNDLTQSDVETLSSPVELTDNTWQWTFTMPDKDHYVKALAQIKWANGPEPGDAMPRFYIDNENIKNGKVEGPDGFPQTIEDTESYSLPANKITLTPKPEAGYVLKRWKVEQVTMENGKVVPLVGGSSWPVEQAGSTYDLYYYKIPWESWRYPFRITAEFVEDSYDFQLTWDENVTVKPRKIQVQLQRRDLTDGKWYAVEEHEISEGNGWKTSFSVSSGQQSSGSNTNATNGPNANMLLAAGKPIVLRGDGDGQGGDSGGGGGGQGGGEPQNRIRILDDEGNVQYDSVNDNPDANDPQCPQNQEQRGANYKNASHDENVEAEAKYDLDYDEKGKKTGAKLKQKDLKLHFPVEVVWDSEGQPPASVTVQLQHRADANSDWENMPNPDYKRSLSMYGDWKYTFDLDNVDKIEGEYRVVELTAQGAAVEPDTSVTYDETEYLVTYDVDYSGDDMGSTTITNEGPRHYSAKIVWPVDAPAEAIPKGVQVELQKKDNNGPWEVVEPKTLTPEGGWRGDFATLVQPAVGVKWRVREIDDNGNIVVTEEDIQNGEYYNTYANFKTEDGVTEVFYNKVTYDYHPGTGLTTITNGDTQLGREVTVELKWDDGDEVFQKEPVTVVCEKYYSNKNEWAAVDNLQFPEHEFKAGHKKTFSWNVFCEPGERFRVVIKARVGNVDDVEIQNDGDWGKFKVWKQNGHLEFVDYIVHYEVEGNKTTITNKLPGKYKAKIVWPQNVPAGVDIIPDQVRVELQKKVDNQWVKQEDELILNAANHWEGTFSRHIAPPGEEWRVRERDDNDHLVVKNDDSDKNDRNTRNFATFKKNNEDVDYNQVQYDYNPDTGLTTITNGGVKVERVMRVEIAWEDSGQQIYGKKSVPVVMQKKGDNDQWNTAPREEVTDAERKIYPNDGPRPRAFLLYSEVGSEFRIREKAKLNAQANDPDVIEHDHSGFFQIMPEQGGDWQDAEYKVTYEVVNNQNGEITKVTNTLLNLRKKFKVTVNWNDASNQDGKWPANVRLKLKKNGADEKTLTINRQNNQNQWVGEFEEVAVVANGQSADFTLEKDGDVPGYQFAVQKNGYSFTVTFTHAVEKTSVNGRVFWIDNRVDRPDDVTIRLRKGGAVQQTKTVEDPWTFEFNNLNKYENGHLIQYEVTEDNVNGYQTERTGYNFTNTKPRNQNQDDNPDQGGQPGGGGGGFIPWLPSIGWGAIGGIGIGIIGWMFGRPGGGGDDDHDSDRDKKIDVTGEVKWEHGNNPEARWPKKCTVRLLANGAPLLDDNDDPVTKELQGTGATWDFTFKGVPKYHSENALTSTKYTVTADAVENYTASFDGTKVTYTYTPGKTQATVRIAWDDVNDLDGIRPGSVDVEIRSKEANDTKRITLTEENGWQGTITDLDATLTYDSADVVKTDVISGDDTESSYAVEALGSQAQGFFFRLTHTPKMPGVSGEIVWDDDNNRFGKRPTSVEVTLWARLSNGQEIDMSETPDHKGKVVPKKTVRAKDGWKVSFTFENIPVAYNGEPITWFLKQTPDPVNAYYSAAEVDGMRVTNRYPSYNITINVTKPQGADADVTVKSGATAAEDENGYKAYAGDTVTLDVTKQEDCELTSLTAKDAGGADVTIENKSFTMPGKDVTVSAVFKLRPKLKVSLEGWTYGDDANTPEVEGVPEGLQAEITYQDKNAGEGSAWSKIMPTRAGDYIVRATTPATNDYLEGEATADFTISRREVHIRGLAVPDKVYDRTASATIKGTPRLNYKKNGDDVQIVSEGVSATFDDADAGKNKDVFITGYGLSGSDAGNYILIQPDDLTASITPREVGLVWSDVTEFTYDGKEHVPTATLTGVLEGDECEVTVTGAQKEVGEYTATATKLSNPNYKLPNNVTKDFRIVKINPTWTPPVARDLTYNGTAQQLVTAGTTTGGTMLYALGTKDTRTDEYAPSIPSGTNAGTYYVWYKIVGDEHYNGYTLNKPVEVIIQKAAPLHLEIPLYKSENPQPVPVSVPISGVMPDDAGRLIYAVGNSSVDPDTAGVTVREFKVNEEAAVEAEISKGIAGVMVTLPVVITSDNYQDSDVKVVVKFTGKTDAKVSFTEGGDRTETYGVPDFPLTAEADVPGKGNGNWTWESSDESVATVTQDVNAGNIGTVKVLKKGVTILKASYESDTTVGEATVKLTVKPRQVSLKWGDIGFTYNGKPRKPSATVTNLVGYDEIYVIVEGAQTDAGTGYTATAVGLTDDDDKAENYILPDDPTTPFTINRKSITVRTPGAGKPYDGTPLTRPLTDEDLQDQNDRYGITGLVEGETATVTATGSQTEVGESENTYKIEWITAKKSNYVITDDFGTLEVTVNNGLIKLTAPSATKVYDRTPLTCDGTGYKKVTATGLPEGFTVEATASGERTDAGSSDNVVNDGYVIRNAEGVDVTEWFTNVEKVDGKLIVEKRSISRAKVTLDNTLLNYNGTEQAVSIESVTLNGYTLKKDVDYTVSGDLSGTNAGDYTVTVTGKGNYKDSASATWTIDPAGTEVTSSGYDDYYDGKEHGINVDVGDSKAVVYYSETELTETNYKTAGSTTAPTFTDAGKHTVYFYVETNNAATKNYTPYPVVGSETVNIKKKRLIVTANNLSKVYGEKDPVLTYSQKGLVGSETLTGSLTRAEGEDVDIYAITAGTLEASDNYDLQFIAGTLTITKAEPKVTAPAAKKLTYTGSAQALVTAGKTTGGKMQYALGTNADAPTTEYTESIPKATDVGTYYVWYRVDGGNNYYDFPPTGPIAVTIAKAAIAPTVNITGWTYGEPANAPSVTGNPGNGAVKYEYSDRADGTYSAAVPVNAGTHYVRAAVAETANYQGATTQPVSFTIAKAVLKVTADKKTKTYGENDPQLTWKQEGLVKGDSLTVTLKRTKGENLGDYAITLDNAEVSDNYTLAFNEAVLNISARSATVTAVDQTITEGEAIRSDVSMVKMSGQVAGHVLSAIKISVAESNGLASNATMKTITVSDAKISDADGNDVTNNYDITYTSGKLKVIGKTDPQPDPEPEPEPEPEPKPEKADYTLLAQMKPCGCKALRVSWTKVDGADGYDVFLVKNGSSFKEAKVVHVTRGLTYKFTGLKKKTVYKAYVQAWRKKSNGKKSTIGRASPTVCAVTGNENKKWTNAAKVTAKKARLSLHVDDKATIKATVKGAKSGKQVLKQGDKLLRYYSSNRNVATVNKSGKVKAVGKGSCTIWVVAANGLRTSVKVKVK